MSRRKGRHERRAARRRERQEARCAEIGGLDEVFSFDALFRAGRECCNNVRWKNSVQRFELHLFSGTAKRRREILTGRHKWANYVHFTISERGKTRPIDAPRIQDRQVHKAFTQNALLPLYRPSMIYNNGASLRGKGYEFTKRMLREELRAHYRRYGREGSIILLDFKQFFPSVEHGEIKKRHERYLPDNGIREFSDGIVDTVPGGRGMPLGVEPSQAEMIAFPSALDNFIKCQLGMKGAGHYMDDYYIIVPPDEDPKEIMRRVIEKAEEQKLTISKNKSRIVPLSKSFRFCKVKYELTESGKVVTHGNRTACRRARRKIHAFRENIGNGAMTYMDLWTSVNGMLAYLEQYNDHGKVLHLRREFFKTYGFSCEHYETFKKKELERCSTSRTDDLRQRRPAAL